MDELAGMTIGQRVRYFRERAGMTRPVLGGLVGRTDEWVKAVETGRLQTPRLPLLLRLAEVLGVADLAKLTGEQKLATATFAGSAHEALPPVAQASHPPVPELSDGSPPHSLGGGPSFCGGPGSR